MIATPTRTAVGARDYTIVLHGVSWETYQSLRTLEANNHVRMTYDQGEFELMSPSRKHGKIATLLGLMIYEWSKLRSIKFESGGNMTCDREDLLKGLEPDLCYWISNEAVVRGKDDIDLLVDPPPDLALEVDVSRSSIAKLPIYEALAVPEVWRWRAARLEVLTLSARGSYDLQAESAALPGFPLRLAEEFLELRDLDDDMTLISRFANRIAAGPQ